MENINKTIVITENQLKTLIETEFEFDPDEIKGKIMRLHDLPDEYKQFACKHVQSITKAGRGNVNGLKLPIDFLKKLKDENLPNGFSFGVDKNGYYIHTHRCRSNSHENFDNITKKEIKFVDSTG